MIKMGARGTQLGCSALHSRHKFLDWNAPVFGRRRTATAARLRAMINAGRPYSINNRRSARLRPVGRARLRQRRRVYLRGVTRSIGSQRLALPGKSGQ
jgi:hypothetical protein